MASDNDFNRHVAKAVSPVVRGIAEKAGQPDDDDEKVVSIGRIGSKPQHSIRFRLKDGTGERFSYSHYYRTIEEEPNAVLVVEFSEHLVRIEGSDLGLLDQWIGDHKARVVEERPERERAAGFGGPKAEPVVYRVTVTAKADVVAE